MSKKQPDLNCLTVIDYVATILVVEESQKTKMIPPCWMVTDEKLRKSWREKAIKFLRDGFEKAGMVLAPTMTDNGICRFAEDSPMLRSKFEEWKKFELEMEQLRKGGNPKAFFLPEDAIKVK